MGIKKGQWEVFEDAMFEGKEKPEVNEEEAKEKARQKFIDDCYEINHDMGYSAEGGFLVRRCENCGEFANPYWKCGNCGCPKP